MKAKIEIGQCYEKDDRIYEVLGKMGPRKFKYWQVRNTLTQEKLLYPEYVLATWRRPFQNFG